MKDLIPGGKSDNMSLADIAKMHNVSIEEITPEYELGLKIESEHSSEPQYAIEATLDHLYEDPKYYTNRKPKNWAQKELEKEGIMEYKVPMFNQFVNEAAEDLTNMPKALRDKWKIAAQRATAWKNSPDIAKLKTELAFAIKYIWSHYFFDKLEYNGINDKVSQDAYKLFQDEFMDMLDKELKGLYYKYTVGKYDILKDITQEEFNSTVEKALITPQGFNLINQFKFKELIDGMLSSFDK